MHKLQIMKTLYFMNFAHINYKVEKEKLWKEIKIGSIIDVLKTETLRDAKLTGWVPAQVKNQDPVKGIQVEFKDGDLLWLENNKNISSYERYTKDWDWRNNLKPGDIIDACDDYGHWFLSTVLAVKTKTKGPPSYEEVLDKVRIGYRFYTPDGNKRDSQGNFYEGWSSVYDEWISINSLRIQKKLSICCEGSVYCKNQIDRTANETYNAGDILQRNDQLEPKYALEREDYESPYVIVKILDEFCRYGGFNILYKKLITDQNNISVRELTGLVKGICCIAPLLHKRYVSEQIKGCYGILMEISTAMLNAKLSVADIKEFFTISDKLSRLTEKIYTQRTKQEKLEQYLILLIKACFSQENNELNSLGEELFEKLCFFREFPYRTIQEPFNWLDTIIGENRIFWNKLWENFTNSFDYSCMTILQLILPSRQGNQKMKKCLLEFDKKIIVEILNRMSEIDPRNITTLQVTLLDKLREFYNKSPEIVITCNKFIWEFSDVTKGYIKVVHDEAKSLCLSRDYIINFIIWAMNDLTSKNEKTKFCSLFRAIDYIDKIFKFNEEISSKVTEYKGIICKTVLSNANKIAVIKCFENYYKNFKKMHTISKDALINTDHKQLSKKGIEIHQKHVQMLLRFINLCEQNVGLTYENIYTIFEILVLNRCLEEDAALFYIDFSKRLSLNYIKKDKIEHYKEKKIFYDFFQHEIAKYENPPCSSQISLILPHFEDAIVMTALIEGKIINISEKTGKYQYTTKGNLIDFKGINLFSNYIEKLKKRPNEIFFESVNILSNFYYQNKEYIKLSELGIITINSIICMIEKGLSNNKIALFENALETINGIINMIEYKCKYFPSAYNFNKKGEKLNCDLFLSTDAFNSSFYANINIYSNKTICNFMAKVCRKVKFPFGTVKIGELEKGKQFDEIDMSDNIEEFIKSNTQSKFMIDIYSKILDKNNKIIPEIEAQLYDFFEKLSNGNQIIKSNKLIEVIGPIDIEINSELGFDEFSSFIYKIADMKTNKFCEILEKLGINLDKILLTQIPLENIPKFFISNNPVIFSSLIKCSRILQKLSN